MCSRIGSGGSKGGGGGAGKSQSELLKGLPESSKKDFYYHEAPNEQYINSGLKDKKDIAKYEAVLVNIAYPKLQGTEKQIKYAKSLISRNISKDIERIKLSLPGDMGSSKQQTAIDNLIAKTNARGGNASTFSDVVNYLVKNNPNGAFKFIQSNNNAGEIIKKFK